jgi:hypothetical protein
MKQIHSLLSGLAIIAIIQRLLQVAPRCGERPGGEGLAEGRHATACSRRRPAGGQTFASAPTG